ncbi:MAG: hypothetical protein U5K30_10875 [Acidimicrobiales bacterium]|nr:hypothetical protein [Acidimicrobiales bacterium]
MSPERIPEVDGLIRADEVVATAEAIADWQLPSGMIPWFPGGHSDAWNHVEAAMALDIGGHRREAERAYDWLLGLQRPDGAWHQYYIVGDDGSLEVEEDKLDANVCAYVATGAYHHYLRHKDSGFLETVWPMVEGAIDFVLDLQTPRGEILWARHPDGDPWTFALLTGSSSISHSLRCAIALAREVGHDRPDWEQSSTALSRVVATMPDAFAPKHRWAMDWYYPVLAGVLAGETGRNHLEARYETFAADDKGVRCVSDRPWITTAETCECAMAYLSVGMEDRARELFAHAQTQRLDDGRYWTGIVYPQEVHFPAEETSTYSAAAVLLCVEALAGASPASALFADHDAVLPPVGD